jgi:hypothetical protein
VEWQLEEKDKVTGNLIMQSNSAFFQEGKLPPLLEDSVGVVTCAANGQYCFHAKQFKRYWVRMRSTYSAHALHDINRIADHLQRHH